MNMRSYSCRCGCGSGKGLKKIEKISQILGKLVKENRLKIFCLLAKKNHCVCSLQEDLGLSQSLVSHHLADLKKLGLVKRKKKGVKVFYSLTKKGESLAEIIFKILNSKETK